MLPIVGRLPHTVITGFWALHALALAVALAWLLWPQRQSATWWRALDAPLWALGGAIVGGRAAFVWQHSAYFEQNVSAVLLPARSGLLYHGALLGALLPLAAIHRGATAFDRYSVPLLWLFGGGWLACYAAGCAAGRPTTAHWLTADLPDAFGLFAVRYQTQLLGVGLTLLVAALLLTRWRGRPRRFWCVLAALSATRLLLAPLRADVAPVDIWLDSALALAALVLAVWPIQTRMQDFDANRR